MSKVKKNKLIKELEETLIKKGVDIEDISDVLKKIENNLKDKKYGLVWEEHTEEIEKELLTKFPILKEEKDLRINKGDEYTNNFLIEGDNLESLTALKNMGKKVDVIEIDPPYGTGKSFIYEDKFVGEEDNYRHSKWVSFIEKRLRISRELLTDEGVIIIHIDDNEMYNLKLLCDGIFGEHNLVTNFVWVNNKRGRSTDKYVSRTNEYILVYAKDILNLKVKPKYEEVDLEREGYVYKDDISMYKRGPVLYNTNSAFNIETRPNLVYSIYLNKETGEMETDDEKETTPEGKLTIGEESNRSEEWVKILPPIRNKNGLRGCWRWGRDKFEREYKEGIMVGEIAGNTMVFTKLRVDEEGKKEVKRKNLVEGIGTKRGTDELYNLFGGKKFDYPKSTQIVKEMIDIVEGGELTILDFFAGSGTMGHAVLEYNKENGTNHNFILATNNENNICRDVTYERLNKVINGYTTPKGKEVEGIPANLTYLKTELVDKEDNLGEFGLDENLIEHSINNLKLIHNLSKETEILENILYELEDSKTSTKYIIYNNFYIDEDELKKVNKSENNIIYVSEENLQDSNLLEFDEVRNLNDLIVYK